MTFSLNRKGLGILTILYGFVLLQLPARADEASAKLYQSKCAACHGPDGSGNTTVGKTLKIRDLRDPDVQKQSDADLAAIIAKGKEKMPAYEKSLKESDIKGLVAHIREVAGKK
jgi:mono/diheme cytochrome c family protein